MQVMVAAPGADAERAPLFKSTPGQTNVQPSWRALIVAVRVQESNNDKRTTNVIEQIVSRGWGQKIREARNC